jgi:bla regulator protein blaR1
MSALLSQGWLTDTAAAVTLLIALVLLLRGPVRRTLGPHIAYALWLLPLARAMMPGITVTIAAPAAPPATLQILTGEAAMVASSGFDPTVTLLALWLGGAVLLFGYGMWSTTRLRRAIAADAQPFRREGRIEIVTSGAVDGPVAMGIRRPLIALPADFAVRFSPAQQRFVLAHELEHHRGHDLAITLAGFALLALNWFNPIAWAGWRAFRQDQETACDARTLARTGGDRVTYGRAIAAAVIDPALRPAGVLALAMSEKSALIHRLRSLTMTDISTRRRWAGRAAVLAGALITLPLTATVSYAVVQQDQAPAPASPAAPRVIVVDGTPEGSMIERRIERDGRTIIVRSTTPIDDAEVNRIVAEAMAERAAIGTAAGDSSTTTSATGDGQRRVVIMRRSTSQSTSSTGGDGAAASSTAAAVNSADREGMRQETTFVFRHDGNAGQGMTSTSCDNDPSAERIERTSTSEQGPHTLRIVRCGGGDAASRLAALRQARASLAAMPADRLPAEARQSALAELDGLIAEAERAPGQ